MQQKCFSLCNSWSILTQVNPQGHTIIFILNIIEQIVVVTCSPIYTDLYKNKKLSDSY